MCVGDWKRGRLIRSVGKAVTVAASSTVFLPANPQRVGLTIAVDATSASIGDILTVTVDGAALIVGALGQGGLHITMLTHGDLPSKRIGLQNIDVANPLVFAVVEYFLPEEALRVAPLGYGRIW
jgi:hypothetical protein